MKDHGYVHIPLQQAQWAIKKYVNAVDSSALPVTHTDRIEAKRVYTAIMNAVGDNVLVSMNSFLMDYIASTPNSVKKGD